ncbi:MAG: response regulator transcription factor [Gemmatimonadaceae bacterium]|nr:response regulator transcription factor [Gemmatimonadaceae bacterium]
MMPRHSVLLVDDHALVRRGLASLLASDGRYTVVGEASNGEAALELIARHRPSLVLLDLSMPKLDGLGTLRRLRKVPRRPRVLVLSMYDDDQFVAQALSDGADGYLLKDAMDDELFEAMDAVVAGQRYLAAGINQVRIGNVSIQSSDLTSREREVLQLIADGQTTSQAAETLAISPHTATRHRANLMRKLGVHNQAELVRTAVQRGLIILGRSRSDRE